MMDTMLTSFRADWSQFCMVFGRYVRLSLHNPGTVAISAVQPLIYLFLFGPLLTGIHNFSGGPRSAYAVYVPGLLIQQALFGGAFTGLTLMTEFRLGVLERMLATPLRRAILLCGRIARDAALLLVQGIVLAVMSLVLGARYPVLAAVCALGLVALIGIALSALSYLIALLTYNEATLSTVFNLILLPVLLLSGALLPVTFGPTWLHVASRLDPVSYLVNGARATFHSVYGGQLVIGYAVALAMATAAFAICLRVLRRA
jgi:ABC-2 type transport system permease protein